MNPRGRKLFIDLKSSFFDGDQPIQLVNDEPNNIMMSLSETERREFNIKMEICAKYNS